ncbi:hypothetical protein Adt_02488 [Abeliophyllum distichum]|uniref:Uncharacterized protein n=1 Tax=Abeliophyllum distichum TaxID=126358 RepID=A0ABD1VW46_9LAMI
MLDLVALHVRSPTRFRTLIYVGGRAKQRDDAPWKKGKRLAAVWPSPRWEGQAVRRCSLEGRKKISCSLAESQVGGPSSKTMLLEGRKEISCSLTESQEGGPSSEAMLLGKKEGNQLQFG